MNYLDIKNDLKSKIANYLASEVTKDGVLSDIQKVILTPRSDMFDNTPLLWLFEENTRVNPNWNKQIGAIGYTMKLHILAICFDSEEINNAYLDSEELISKVYGVIYDNYYADDSRHDESRGKVFEIVDVDSFPDTPIENAREGLVAPSLVFDINFHDKACKYIKYNK